MIKRFITKVKYPEWPNRGGNLVSAMAKDPNRAGYCLALAFASVSVR